MTNPAMFFFWVAMLIATWPYGVYELVKDRRGLVESLRERFQQEWEGV
jgi:hypothetical protein